MSTTRCCVAALLAATAAVARVISTSNSSRPSRAATRFSSVRSSSMTFSKVRVLFSVASRKRPSQRRSSKTGPMAPRATVRRIRARVRSFGLDAKVPQKRLLPGGQICHPGVETLQPRLQTGFVVALRRTFPGCGGLVAISTDIHFQYRGMC
jgi:hypothetical protein